MTRTQISIAAYTATLALMIGMAFGGFRAVAQNATGSPETTIGSTAELAHPGHIHTGTCDAVGEVVFPLNDATPPGMSGSNATGANETGANETGANETGANETPGTAANETAGDGGNATTGSNGTGRGEVVAESVTTIEASLDDLLGAEHVINFHESAENIGTYIACGALNDDDDDDTFDIDLDELNNSGYEGEAAIVDNGDGTLEVTVRLWHDDDDDNGDGGNATGSNGSNATGGTGGNGGNGDSGTGDTDDDSGSDDSGGDGDSSGSGGDSGGDDEED